MNCRSSKAPEQGISNDGTLTQPFNAANFSLTMDSAVMQIISLRRTTASAPVPLLNPQWAPVPKARPYLRLADRGKCVISTLLTVPRPIFAIFN